MRWLRRPVDEVERLARLQALEDQAAEEWALEDREREQGRSDVALQRLLEGKL